MKTKSIFLTLSAACFAVTCFAAAPGGIDENLLKDLRKSGLTTPADRAIHNAMNATDLNTLAKGAGVHVSTDDYFTYRVKSKGITNQQSSGRCWLFTGLNVLRGQAINQYNLGELELSQVFNFVYDQLEKSNLFLQSVIDTGKEPMDNRRVEWLFRNPLSDGGQFTGVSDIITKYGVVPHEVMPETYTSNHTSQFSKMLTTKLREDALELRKMIADGKKATDVEKRKQAMLGQVWHMLVLAYGEPPAEFEYEARDAKGNSLGKKKYTPVSFYNEMFGNDLRNDYVMIMNDPTRPYYKLYEIDLDRHVYDGDNWKYVNLPMDAIKKIAIESLRDSAMMYFSCDVAKFLDRDNGTLDLTNYDYESLLGTSFGMDKRERIITGASGSSHAMTLVGVDINDEGAPTRWLIENSWGQRANKGHLIATDEWMDEYLFRLVVQRRFVPQEYLDILKQKPVLLPAWDYMF